MGRRTGRFNCSKSNRDIRDRLYIIDMVFEFVRFLEIQSIQEL